MFWHPLYGWRLVALFYCINVCRKVTIFCCINACAVAVCGDHCLSLCQHENTMVFVIELSLFIKAWLFEYCSQFGYSTVPFMAIKNSVSKIFHVYSSRIHFRLQCVVKLAGRQASHFWTTQTTNSSVFMNCVRPAPKWVRMWCNDMQYASRTLSKIDPVRLKIEHSASLAQLTRSFQVWHFSYTDRQNDGQ